MPADVTNDVLLVTGASGKQSTRLIPHLIDQGWKHLRLQVHSDASKERLKQQYKDHPDIQVVKGDLASQQDCQALIRDVNAVWLVVPGVSGKESDCGTTIMDAAMTRGDDLKHFVFSSVLHPIIRKLMNHDSKRYIEEYLLESGLPFTVLQPSTVMENLPIQKILSESEPVYDAMFSPSTLMSFTSLRDYGEAAANVLTQREKHFYATYETVSTSKPLTYADGIKMLSEMLGKNIKINEKTVDEGVRGFSMMMTGGHPGKVGFPQAQAIGRLLMYYNMKGLLGSSNVLEMLLGRKPLEYRDWLKLEVEESKKQ
ncbi:NAD(P)-binding protein [Teratosphaeria destructans]|uniref:NAD(P)-binding protein n=1 Tax=Teratosphaeria destructans TaxID=418781 RepID=A0A9W7SHQ5_9PEZI|nr:NAD(P)-binding protein [Teratosphaeria destructans]